MIINNCTPSPRWSTCIEPCRARHDDTDAGARVHSSVCQVSRKWTRPTVRRTVQAALFLSLDRGARAIAAPGARTRIPRHVRNDLANHGSSLYGPLRKSADTPERGAKLIRMSAATCDFSEHQAHGHTCDFKLAFRRDNSLIEAT